MSFKPLKQSFLAIFKDAYLTNAAALAFTTTLSIVPIISVFIYFMSHSPMLTAFSDEASHYVANNFIPSTSQEIITYLKGLSHQASQTPRLSFMFLFLSAYLLVMTIDNSMRKIWHKNIRKNIYALFAYLLTVLLIPIFIGIAAVINSLLHILLSSVYLVNYLGSFVPTIVNTALLAIFYSITSSASIKAIDVIKGGMLAAILIEIARLVFAIYIQHFSNYTEIYGALSTIPVFLLWIYIFWLLIFYGALFAKALSDNTST